MSFLPATIIKKKRDGGSLSFGEISDFVNAYSDGQLPDYQMSAWLMSVVLKGMSLQEASDLTSVMLNTGRKLSFNSFQYKAVDKHSTGGIGDKTSLIIAPLVASCGVPVPMMAGRGLGHTGGTLDKLESIPGYSVDMSLDHFTQQIEEIGGAIIGQTDEICPADKKMYALRDVTATVESLPLICGSILSKKIAEGISGLVLDVKYGSGAFMKTLEEAESLAKWLVNIADKNQVQTRALITNMQQPLGRAIGNSLEVWECLALLNPDLCPQEWKQYDFVDTRELSVELSAEMLHLAGRTETLSEAQDLAHQALQDGSAYKMFEKIVKAQGGDLSGLPRIESTKRTIYKAPNSGFIESFDGEALGYTAITLGAGRKSKGDPLDLTAGIFCLKKQGESIEKGDPLFEIFCDHPEKTEAALSRLENCYSISLQKPHNNSLIVKKVLAHGSH